MRKSLTWVVLGLCAATLLMSSIGHCEEAEASGEPQIPVGARATVCLPEHAECDLSCAEEPAEPLTLGLFLSDAIHPGATHQIVEVLTGPIGIPLVDGRVYALPPGLYVRLEDTSIWRILDNDVWAMQDWLPSDALHLTPNPTWFSTRYRYHLCNLNTQVQVRVCPEVGPRACWSLRYFIYDRSLIANEIILNDGSLWRVSRADAGVFSQWLPNDSVIIGVNTDWMRFRRRNILINLTTNDFVRCSWMR